MTPARIAHLVPAPGRHIPDPDDRFKPLPPEGKRVRISTYWIQLLGENEVTEALPVPESKSATKASKADS